jgi:hypothetical protein
VRASLAMVCMMFIAHTISTYSQSFKMGCPAAYHPQKMGTDLKKINT